MARGASRSLTTANPSADLVWTDALPSDEPCEVQFQASNVSAGASILLSLTYSVGADGVVFTRTFLATGNVRRFRVQARMLHLSASLVAATRTPFSGAPPANATGTISASATTRSTDPMGDVMPAWIMDGTIAASDAPYGTAGQPLQGTLLGAIANVTSLGGNASLWLYFVDGVAVPADGAVTPLVPPVLITSTGTYNFDDSRRYSGDFSTGVAWFLSTTGNNTKTTAADGRAARVDLKIGA
jgi:hypothetical protein